MSLNEQPASQPLQQPLPQARAPQNPMNNQGQGDLEFFASLIKQATAEKQPQSDDSEQPSKDEQPEDEPLKLELLTDLGKRLKLADADLYKIKVPSAREGAEPFTLGQLKDLAAEHDTFTVRQLQLEDEHRQRSAQYARAEQELQDILQLLPPDAIKPETRTKIAERRQKATLAERQRVLDAIPEWRDATVRTQEIEGMIEHMRDQGFPETYLSTVLDHRTLRYIRGNWLREKQLRSALERVKERKSSPAPKSNKQVQQKKAVAPVSQQPRGVNNFAEILQKAAQQNQR